MSQKYFQIFRSKISDLRSENVDYLKKPPWKNFFFYIFAIHSSSRYEKRCQMLQRLFWLFQCSKNQLWKTCSVKQTCRLQRRLKVEKSGGGGAVIEAYLMEQVLNLLLQKWERDNCPIYLSGSDSHKFEVRHGGSNSTHTQLS